MLEIIMLFLFTHLLDKRCEQKGVFHCQYKLYVLLFWISGEIVGGLLGRVLFGSFPHKIYIFAFTGGVIGMTIAFILVNNLLVKDSKVEAISDNRYGNLSN